MARRREKAKFGATKVGKAEETQLTWPAKIAICPVCPTVPWKDAVNVAQAYGIKNSKVSGQI